MVATAKSGAQKIDEKNLEALDFSKVTLHQAKRLEMDSQVMIVSNNFRLFYSFSYIIPRFFFCIHLPSTILITTIGDLGVWVVSGVSVTVIWGFWVVVGYLTPKPTIVQRKQPFYELLFEMIWKKLRCEDSKTF